MTWNEITAWCLIVATFIALPIVTYKLFKTPPRKPRQ